MKKIFSDHTFPKYNERNVMKSQMKGFEDPALKEFTLLNSSVLMKAELKDEKFEDEFIHSFLNAAKVLAKAGRKATDRPNMYVMTRNSYAIPVLFLTRHCMELSIKRAIKKSGRKPKTDHSLLKLWSSLLSSFPEQRSGEDQKSIKNMRAFIKFITSIDDNGISLRYPHDKSGKLTQDETLFVNNEQIVTYLEKFVTQLELIDFNSICKDDA